MRRNVSEQSFVSSMLWDVERMLDENQDFEYIVISIHRRLSKYLRYEDRILESRRNRREAVR